MTLSPAPWVGQILIVDLGRGTWWTVPTAPHAAAFFGGRGLAARLAWELIPPGIGAFDPPNPLMFLPGALVGTPAPSAGRVSISGLSPQAYPHEWFTRSNLGGHWGAELKYAGYDGLVVIGQAPQPVYLWIEDGRVELRDAGHLWGLGIITTQTRLRQELGADIRALAIGPAGENRVRLAIIATNTESAAGQGGFGAVMGSKRLKAIAVRGHGGVRVARPSEMLRRSRLLVQAVYGRYGRPSLPREDQAAADRRLPPCTYQCPRACGSFHRQVPGVVHPERRYSGQFFCVAQLLAKGEWLKTLQGFPAGFEIAQLANDLGLNHWELIMGLAPWLRHAQEQGELRRLDGEELNLDDPQFWGQMVMRIAYRQGWGDVLAEGGPRAAHMLGVGQEALSEFYPAWGQASHWDGHGSYPAPFFPYWLVTALQWALDSRDPLGGGHDYTTNIFGLLRSFPPEDEASLRKFLAAGERLFGSAAAVDPRSSYEDKALPAVLHQDRNALKDALGICDNIFPLLTDPHSADFLVEVDGVEGRFLEHYLFQAASDVELTREEFYRVGTRIFTLERLLAIRNWGRSRATDETILPYLQRPEGTINPYVGHPVALEPQRFRELLDACYRLRGWDPRTTAPTPETLRALGLAELAATAPHPPSQEGGARP